MQETPAGCIAVTTKNTFDGDELEQAKWKKAVEELLEEGRIEKVGPSSYEVTERGKEITP